MFVRKRDPRYKAHLKSQSQPATTSSLAHPPALQTKTEPAAVYVEQEWQKTRVSGVEDLEWALVEGSDDPEVFECVACGKSFKSEAAWSSHERSKKHIKNVEVLRRQMEEEARELGLSGPNDELGSEPTEDRGQSEGSVTPPPDDGSGTEHGNLHDAQGSPEYRAQAALVEETLPEGNDKTQQTLSQSEQKLSKKDKRRLREAAKQAQAVDNTHVSVGKGHVDIRLTTGHRNVMFAKKNSRADPDCSTTSEAQATQPPGQPRTQAQKRRERRGRGSG
jgi:DnaJ family protein A protein 5